MTGGRAAGVLIGLLLPLAAWSQASHPFGVPESGGGLSGGPDWLAALFGQISAWQTHFYRQLTGAVRAWQADGTAAWGLLGLSFAYGVFHALGPGHGKAVIASYVLANRQTARNGALLALLSALLQALVAIGLVALLAWLLSATAPAMNRATRWLETASYALIVALGAWLVWQKALRPWLRRARRSGHEGAGGHVREHEHEHGHGHGHDHGREHRHGLADCGCGHAHVPAAAQVAGPLEWRKALAAILAMGLRPCSGALIVLVFALSQDFFAAGVAAALAMGMGTGLTVAALAVLAVLAGGAATRVGARLSTAWAARLRAAIEALAALCILLLGLLLLGGQVAGGA
ncbi:nickel transporter [Bordetella petrii]|nr:nickel transporter [Bordetella petrii]